MTTPLSYALDHVELLQKENERLQCEIAMLREALIEQPTYRGLSEHELKHQATILRKAGASSEWRAAHDAKVRNDALEEAALEVLDESQDCDKYDFAISIRAMKSKEE